MTPQQRILGASNAPGEYRITRPMTEAEQRAMAESAWREEMAGEAEDWQVHCDAQLAALARPEFDERGVVDALDAAFAD